MSVCYFFSEFFASLFWLSFFTRLFGCNISKDYCAGTSPLEPSPGRLRFSDFGFALENGSGLSVLPIVRFFVSTTLKKGFPS
jgi:hypothetical protein